MEIKKNEDSKQLKTNQSFVHIKHSITIRQYKYWHLLLKFFSEQIEQGIKCDQDGFYYESRSKLSNYIGYELMTKELKMDFEALRKEPIILNYLGKDGKPALHGQGFISEWKVSSNRIGFRFPSFIEKVVKGEDESRKLFLLLNWSIFNSFNGKYEAIIYKLCKDYIGISRTPYFSLEEYRDYIGLRENEYNETKSLMRRCISEPIKKINESEISDIEVKVELSKIGNSIVGLYFTAAYKKQASLPFEEFNPCPAFNHSKISIPLDKQAKYLEAYSNEEIEAIIERANNYIDRLKEQNKTINMGAIYNRAFEQNWGAQVLEQNNQKKIEDDKKQKESDFVNFIISKAVENKLLGNHKHGIINHAETIEELSKRIALDYQRNKGYIWANKFKELGIKLDEDILNNFSIKIDYSDLDDKNNDDYIIAQFDNFDESFKKTFIENMVKNLGNNDIEKIIKKDFKNIGLEAYKRTGLFRNHLIEKLKTDTFFQSMI